MGTHAAFIRRPCIALLITAMLVIACAVVLVRHRDTAAVRYHLWRAHVAVSRGRSDLASCCRLVSLGTRVGDSRIDWRGAAFAPEVVRLYQLDDSDGIMVCLTTGNEEWHVHVRRRSDGCWVLGKVLAAKFLG